jgi:hypothetical protein
VDSSEGEVSGEGSGVVLARGTCAGGRIELEALELCVA